METYNMLKKEIRRYIYDQNWQKFTKYKVKEKLCGMT